MGASQKVAIITGASQGVGEALVKAYRDRNFYVIANSRSIRPSTDPDVLAVAGDITESATAERVVSQAIEHFGRVDTLINNAGIFIGNLSLSIRLEIMPAWWRLTSTAFSISLNALSRKCSSGDPGISCRSRAVSTRTLTAAYRPFWQP